MTNVLKSFLAESAINTSKHSHFRTVRLCFIKSLLLFIIPSDMVSPIALALMWTARSSSTTIVFTSRSSAEIHCGLYLRKPITISRLETEETEGYQCCSRNMIDIIVI